MISQVKTSIGLTQFIDFTVKGSAAKVTMVRNIKYQEDYHPAFDYWKQLRDGIIKFHEEDLKSDFLDALVEGVDEKKKENYALALRQYRKFLKNKEITWFNPGKSTWLNNDIAVRSSPELGLIINGIPHLIKLYFKGKTEKVDKRTSKTILALMNTSSYDVNHPDSMHHSVLNIQRNNFITDDKVNQDQLLALESEATQFMHIWNNI